MDFGGIWWHSFGTFRHFWYHQCVQRCWQPHLVALFLCGRSVDKGNRVQDRAPHTISGGLIQPFAYSRWALKTTTTVTNKLSPPPKNINAKNVYSVIPQNFTWITWLNSQQQQTSNNNKKPRYKRQHKGEQPDQQQLNQAEWRSSCEAASQFPLHIHIESDTAGARGSKQVAPGIPNASTTTNKVTTNQPTRQQPIN